MKKAKKVLVLVLAVVLLAAMVPGLQSVMNAAAEGDFKAMVSAGGGHTAVVKNDGSLWTWGSNTNGQLGNGTIIDSAIPIEIMDNVIFVSAGFDCTAAIKKDGTLWTWGGNKWGQLGDGTNTDHSIPIQIMDGVATVSVKESCIAAIKIDGTLWTWGFNADGELGDGTTTNRNTPVKIIDDVSIVSTGSFCMAAIKNDNSLWMWGDNSNGLFGNGTINKSYTTPIKIMDGIKAVSFGYVHTAIIKTDGSLWTCGSNDCGQLGDGTTINSISFIEIMENVNMVSTGYANTAAIKTDGSLWVWGEESLFGDYQVTDSILPVKIMDNIIAVSLGGSFFIVMIKADGTVWTFGYGCDPIQVLGENGVGYFNVGENSSNSDNTNLIEKYFGKSKTFTLANAKYSASNFKSVNTSVGSADQKAFVDGLLSCESVSPTTIDKVYNLLFQAQYRPDVFGAVNNANWPIKNSDSMKNYVDDNIINKVQWSSPAKGCLAYAHFCAAYIYGKEGTKKQINGTQTSEQIKQIFDQNITIGSTIYYCYYNLDKAGNYIPDSKSSSGKDETAHAIVYLGESSDGAGFFFLSYAGGGSSKSSNEISLNYITYSNFADIAFDWLRVYKNNQVTTKPDNITIKVQCPIDICVSLDNEQLNSATKVYTSSFGTMSVTGSEQDKNVELSLDYNEDYQITITGIGEGNMDMQIVYGDEMDSQTFIGVPISNKTVITTSSPYINSDCNLFINNSDNLWPDAIWSANPGETVYEADQELTEFYQNVDKSGGFGITFGDINSDTRIDTVDARLVLQSIVGKTTFDQNQRALADVNQDGKIDTVDARLILQLIVGKIEHF